MGSKIKVEIICLLHGCFSQLPSHHLEGDGCRKCSHDERRTTKEKFIHKANKIHNNYYDYSNTNYEKHHSKIEIICPQHGTFKQRASNHLRGIGCPICKQSKGERLVRSYLEQNNFNFKQEHIVNNFRFDFVVIKDDLPMVIEFNGRQHYIPGNFGSKKENADFEIFLTTTERDCRKYKKLKENNIPLIIIPYWDINRIPEILDDFFNGIEPTYSQPPKIVIQYKKYHQTEKEN